MNPPRVATPSPPKPPNNKMSSAKLQRKRYNELRKSGMDTQAAMKAVRSEFDLEKEDALSSGSKVAQMFGMPL